MHHSKNRQVLLGAIMLSSCLVRNKPVLVETPAGEITMKEAGGRPVKTRKQRAHELLRDISWGEGPAAGAASRELEAMAGPDLTPILLDRLVHGGGEAEFIAARLLAGLGETRAVLHIIRMAESGHPGEYDLIAMLGDLRDRQALPLLMKRLSSDDPAMRAVSAEALGAVGAPDSAAAIIPLMGDRNSGVRSRAARALGALGDPAASGPLVIALTDREEYVRASAISALGEIGEPAIPDIFDSIIYGSADHRIECREALIAMGGKAVPALMEAAVHGADILKYEAIMALGNIGDGRAVPALVTALGHADANIRGSAANALRMIGAPAARARLEELAENDESEFVRSAARAALSN